MRVVESEPNVLEAANLSHDHNSIEQLWKKLKQAVDAMKPTNIPELFCEEG